jgi:hypothetical protein
VRGAARRIVVLVAVVFGVTAAVSALLGLLAGSSLDRAVSVGFYLVGSLFIILGFFSGVRGPLRPRGRDDASSPGALFGMGIFSSGARMATADERIDARATAWLFLLLGIGLVLAGVLVDSRVGLT